jgi:hypothetical protein
MTLIVVPKLATLSPLITTEGLSVSFAKNIYKWLANESMVTGAEPINNF